MSDFDKMLDNIEARCMMQPSLKALVFEAFEGKRQSSKEGLQAVDDEVPPNLTATRNEIEQNPSQFCKIERQP